MSHPTLFRLLFIALFAFSYQNSTIHSKHHHINEISKCDICHATAHSGQRNHQQALQYFTKHIGIETQQLQNKEIKRESYTWSTLPLQRLSDFDGLEITTVSSIPLGYFSTAPPYFS